MSGIMKNQMVKQWGLGLALVAALTPWARAEDPKYPDGLTGQAPVIRRISMSSPYTVPAGQNLYIISVAGASQRCGMLELSCHLTATGATNLLNPFFAQPGAPIMVGPGAVVSSTSSSVAFDINGFLVPATVPVIVADLSPSAGYVVPTGKNFYLMRIGAVGDASQPVGLMVGGIKLSASSSDPILVGSGQTITNSGSTMITLIGYLKPQ